MKGRKGVKITALMICLALLSTSFACTLQSREDDAARNFDITILDENGNASSDTEVFLYNFLDERVVARDKTDSEGKAQIRYFPDLDNSQPSKLVYGDYIIYAVKDGYTRPEYSMTKIYCNLDYCSEDETASSRRINMEKHVIKLEKEKTTSEREDTAEVSKEGLAKQAVIDKVRKALIAERKLTKKAPIYVLTEEDYRSFEEKGIATEAELKSLNTDASWKSIPASGSELRNKVTPIMKVHGTEAAKISVKLQTSDGIKVETGVKASGESGGFHICGSRTRMMEDCTTTFPEYTAAKSGVCKLFNTRASYTTWQTLTYYGDDIKDHIGLSSLNGGMAIDNNGRPSYDKETTCADCNKTFAAAESYDYVRDMDDKNFIKLMDIREKTIDLGEKVSFTGLGANLGVSSVTGTAASIRYTPKSDYALRLYSDDGKLWHCTQKAL